jgi:hypothetical protein
LQFIVVSFEYPSSEDLETDVLVFLIITSYNPKDTYHAEGKEETDAENDAISPSLPQWGSRRSNWSTAACHCLLIV